ncbi:MAG: 50S ribosomal protein L11 methyltransferase [Akkermansia sp.]|nr:50S ribosomal protein L11 methyltransferase [Akkermansia sp.]
MWQWHKTAPAEQETLWQQRLENVAGAVISAGFQASRLSVDVYTENAEEALVLQACYGGTVEELATVDWVAATAPENTPPLIIRDKIVISASADEAVLAELHAKYPRRIILTFPAERAFGTGNHATTSTCLRMLCDHVRHLKPGSWTLADIGCGTGVLALAGLRLGAAHAISFDFDPVAVEVAERNIERNGGAENLELFQADVFEWTPAPGQQADVVLANLFSTVLQKAFPRLIAAMKDEGILIISGILNTQAAETLAAAEAAGLKVQKSISRGKWTTAQLTKA